MSSLELSKISILGKGHDENCAPYFDWKIPRGPFNSNRGKAREWPSALFQLVPRTLATRKNAKCTHLDDHKSRHWRKVRKLLDSTPRALFDRMRITRLHQLGIWVLGLALQMSSFFDGYSFEIFCTEETVPYSTQCPDLRRIPLCVLLCNFSPRASTAPRDLLWQLCRLVDATQICMRTWFAVTTDLTNHRHWSSLITWK